jgi:hypothetical protein
MAIYFIQEFGGNSLNSLTEFEVNFAVTHHVV